MVANFTLLTYNVHKMFIYSIGIPKHKNTYDFLVQVRNFLLPLSLKVFRHKKRDTIVLCWLFNLSHPNTCGACNAQIRLASPRSHSQLTDFSQISAHASGAWRHSHPLFYPLSGIFIMISLNDTSALHARELLHSCLHLTKPCTESKGSLPN